MTVRVGFGYDAHRFGAPRPLVLGGVEIEHPSGLEGHSDGDAVAHAVTDALLGAAALGDIGRLFSDRDDRWKGADSLILLARVVEQLAAVGYRVGNVDVTVVTEDPRLGPHVDAMRERLATVLGVAVRAVSVKAKTKEGMDAVGEGQGLEAYAVATVLGA